MIFDEKQDGHRKARLAIGGHILNASSVMKTILTRLLLVIPKANKYQVLTGNIKNVYLYADCNINICTWIEPEFELAGFKELKTESMAKVEKALSCLPSSEQNWHSHLADTLWTLGFKPAKYD